LQPVTLSASTQTNTVMSFTYDFDLGTANNDNVMSWSAVGAQSFTRTFTYDELNRVKMTCPHFPRSRSFDNESSPSPLTLLPAGRRSRATGRVADTAHKVSGNSEEPCKQSGGCNFP